MNRRGPGVIPVVVMALAPAGCSLPAVVDLPPPLAFDLVEPRLGGAPLGCLPQAVWEAPDGALALACLDATRTPPEAIVAVSHDDGNTWSRTGAVPPGYSDPQIIDGALHIVGNQDGRLWHAVSRDLGRSWSRAAMIVDYPVMLTNHGDAAMTGESGLVLVVWSERREGRSAVYASRSDDQGRTWQSPRLIERGASGKSMTRVSAAMAGGRVAVAWADDRDSSTLFDIRCALSTDGGKTWLPSARVNDDAEAVWQDRPSVAVRADRLLVLFDDVREPWIEGDRDYNIYAGRSGGGVPRFQNGRVNDLTPGMQLGPRVAVSPDGRRVAAVWWDLGDSLFGELSAAQSLDWGESWSPAAHVWKWEPGTENEGGRLTFRRDGRLAVAVHVERDGRPALVIALERLGGGPGAPRPGLRAAELSIPEPLPAADSGTVRASDGFSGESAPQWVPVHGTWLVNAGSFVGFGERETLTIRSEPRFGDGEVTGRFRLDPVEHRSARVLVRASPGSDGWRGYLVENYFRMGVRLWRQDGTRRIPVASALFPFQRDRWYRFRLALSGSRLDYEIDDRLLLQTDGLAELSAGQVGLGGEYFPVYFDDVTVAVASPTGPK
ncbi:MAG: sialidase family protein [Acidobacteriota bacterium]